jgi:hypothetical protein
MKRFAIAILLTVSALALGALGGETSGAAAPTGWVTGSFSLTGGVATQPGHTPPLSGTIVFTKRLTSERRTTLGVEVGMTGEFSVRLVPGTWTVVGTTTELKNARGGPESCPASKPIVVTAGSRTYVSVTCVDL